MSIVTNPIYQGTILRDGRARQWMNNLAHHILEKESLTIRWAGYGRWNMSDFATRDRFKYHGFELVCAGDAIFRQNNKEYVLKPGSIFYKQKGKAHYYAAGPSGFLHKRYVSISGTLADIIVSNFGIANHDCIVTPNTEQYHKIKNAIKKSIRLLSQVHTSTNLSVCAYEILAEIAACITRHEYPESIERALAYIRDNILSPVTLKQCARAAGLSQSRFSALFQKHLGVSPINYFHRQRIEYAKTLLSNENISVKETAARLGFDDQLAFSAHFKRLVGVSPKTFRGK
jgi:AraC-like DNA-binding protein